MTRLFVSSSWRLTTALLQSPVHARDVQAARHNAAYLLDQARHRIAARVLQSRNSCHEAATPCPQLSLRCCPPLVMRNAASISHRGWRVTDEASRSQKANRISGPLMSHAFAPVALRSVAAGSYWRLGVDSCRKRSRSWPTIQALFCVAELWGRYASSCVFAASERLMTEP